MTAHLFDLLPNVSFALQGCSREEEILGLPNKRSSRGSHWRNKAGEGLGAGGCQGGRLYAGVEDDMRLQAYGIQMRRSRAMKERQEVWRCASGRLLVINIQRVVPN